MAICNPQTLESDGACFACLDSKEMQMAKLALLCGILQALNPMASCDPADLVTSGACFGCLDAKQAQIAELQLLCEIKDLGAGGGGITSGNGAPSTPPPTGNGIYYNKTDSSLWAWDSTLGIWVELIA